MFKVVRRVEVPRAEYSFDAAVNMIIALNQIYNPAFIYADAGSGEYQIEMNTNVVLFTIIQNE